MVGENDQPRVLEHEARGDHPQFQLDPDAFLDEKLADFALDSGYHPGAFQRFDFISQPKEPAFNSLHEAVSLRCLIHTDRYLPGWRNW